MDTLKFLSPWDLPLVEGGRFVRLWDVLWGEMNQGKGERREAGAGAALYRGFSEKASLIRGYLSPGPREVRTRQRLLHKAHSRQKGSKWKTLPGACAWPVGGAARTAMCYIK